MMNCSQALSAVVTASARVQRPIACERKESRTKALVEPRPRLSTVENSFRPAPPAQQFFAMSSASGL